MKPILVFAFSVHSFSMPVGHDSWFGTDKVKHFFMGTFAQSAAFGGLRATGLGRNPAIAGASVFTLSVVVAKEVRDRNGKGTPSYRDAAWGLAGGTIATPLLLRTR